MARVGLHLQDVVSGAVAVVADANLCAHVPAAVVTNSSSFKSSSSPSNNLPSCFSPAFASPADSVSSFVTVAIYSLRLKIFQLYDGLKAIQ